jgi:hypothetical protein
MARHVSGKARPYFLSVRLSEEEMATYRGALAARLSWSVVDDPGISEAALFRLLLDQL